MNKLDKTKPYGVIGGHPAYRYEQNGKYFDVNFNEIVPEPVVQLETLTTTFTPTADCDVAVGPYINEIVPEPLVQLSKVTPNKPVKSK